MEVIEVGPGKEFDTIFVGTISKKKIKRKEGFRIAAGIQKSLEADAFEGIIAMFETLDKVYPKINIAYDGVKYTSIEDLYETTEGEELVNKCLIPRVSGAVSLSKN
jgi:hypothetical protein